MRRAFIAGLVVWVIGTVVFRFAGASLVHPPSLRRTIPSYLVNCAIAMIVVRLLLPRLGLPRDQWPAAATLFILPTLLLDPFATAFFPQVFPNLPPAAAPTFGGLMLVSAGGAVIGAWLGW
jgi:hypothetical protein